ncbi:KTSC domain-containing protein [Caballeronia sp. KNU42]
MSTELEEKPAPVVIAMDEIVSSQLHSIGHHPESSTLAIRFKAKDGSPAALYHYANVSDEDFAAFKGAESIGSHFYRNIKPHATKYPFVCIEKKTPAQQEQT